MRATRWEISPRLAMRTFSKGRCVVVDRNLGVVIIDDAAKVLLVINRRAAASDGCRIFHMLDGCVIVVKWCCDAPFIIPSVTHLELL